MEACPARPADMGAAAAIAPPPPTAAGAAWLASHRPAHGTPLASRPLVDARALVAWRAMRKAVQGGGTMVGDAGKENVFFFIADERRCRVCVKSRGCGVICRQHPTVFSDQSCPALLHPSAGATDASSGILCASGGCFQSVNATSDPEDPDPVLECAQSAPRRRGVRQPAACPTGAGRRLGRPSCVSKSVCIMCP